MLRRVKNISGKQIIPKRDFLLSHFDSLLDFSDSRRWSNTDESEEPEICVQDYIFLYTSEQNHQMGHIQLRIVFFWSNILWKYIKSLISFIIQWSNKHTLSLFKRGRAHDTDGLANEIIKSGNLLRRIKGYLC